MAKSKGNADHKRRLRNRKLKMEQERKSMIKMQKENFMKFIEEQKNKQSLESPKLNIPDSGPVSPLLDGPSI